MQSTEAERKLRDASEQAAEAREQAAKKERDILAERERLQKKESQVKLAATRDLHNLQSRVDAQAKKVGEIEKGMSRAEAGIAKDAAKNAAGIGGAYRYARNADGGISDFQDWRRANRFGLRAARDAARNDRATAQGLKKFDELDAERVRRMAAGKKLSDRDEKKWQELKQWKDQLDAGKKAREELARRQQELKAYRDAVT